MNSLRLVIIQGPSAAGKTSLSHELSKQLGIGLLAKDSIKEMMFDTLGLPIDRDASRDYGRAAVKGLYVISHELLEQGISHIIESAFHPNLAELDFASIQKSYPNLKMIQLYCHAPADVLLQRYRHRIRSEERHPGHLSSLETPLECFSEQLQIYTPIQNIPVININTTSYSPESLQSFVTNLIESINRRTHATTN